MRQEKRWHHGLEAAANGEEEAGGSDATLVKHYVGEGRSRRGDEAA
jgi:hypothetical protein